MGFCETDLNAMTGFWKSKGAEIVVGLNKTKKELKDLISTVQSKLTSGSYKMLVFYYSGHGVQDHIVSNDEKTFKTVEIMTAFDEDKLCKFFIWDCCRGELEKQVAYKGQSQQFRSSRIVLRHTVQAFATTSGFVAVGAENENQLSPYTKALLQAFESVQGDRSLPKIMNQTHAIVYDDAGKNGGYDVVPVWESSHFGQEMEIPI